MKKFILLLLICNIFISDGYSQYVKAPRYKLFKFTFDSTKADANNIKVFSNECDTVFTDIEFPENLAEGNWIGYYIGKKAKACEVTCQSPSRLSVKIFYPTGIIRDSYNLIDGKIYAFSQIQLDKIYLSLKYIPFSAHFNSRMSESDIATMKSKKFLIVKNDTIINSSVNKAILEKIKSLGKKDGQKITYDLRMECTIFVNGEIIKFYIDKNKNIILNGNVYSNTEIVNTLFENICHPYFSTYLDEEKKYWSNKTQQCNDSLEFFNYYPRK